ISILISSKCSFFGYDAPTKTFGEIRHPREITGFTHIPLRSLAPQSEWLGECKNHLSSALTNLTTGSMPSREGISPVSVGICIEICQFDFLTGLIRVLQSSFQFESVQLTRIVISLEEIACGDLRPT